MVWILDSGFSLSDPLRAPPNELWIQDSGLCLRPCLASSSRAVWILDSGFSLLGLFSGRREDSGFRIQDYASPLDPDPTLDTGGPDFG